MTGAGQGSDAEAFLVVLAPEEGFDGLDLSDAEMEDCSFSRCSCRGASLSSAITRGCLFEHCDFTDAKLNGSEHRRSAFLNCSFKGASLFSADFEECKLVGAALEEADLTAFVIRGGDLSYANFFEKEDLKGQDLRGVRLVEAELNGCDLTKTNLRGADLGRANLSRAKLRGADLRGANLEGVDLSGLYLRGVKLDVEQAILLARCHGTEVDLARASPLRRRNERLPVATYTVPGSRSDGVSGRPHALFTRVPRRGQPVEKVGMELITTANRARNAPKPVCLVPNLE